MSQKNDQLLAGWRTIKITPSMPLPMFPEARRGKAVLDDLFLKVFVFQQGRRRIVVAVFDLLWLTPGFCKRLWLSATSGFPSLAGVTFFLTATHTHSGPDMRVASAEYLEELRVAFLECLGGALCDMRPCTLSYGMGTTGIAVNRRKRILDRQALKRGKIKFTMANRPNLKASVDNVVRVLKIKPEEEDPVFIVNAACHAVVWSGKSYSADFPGRLRTAWYHKPSNYVFLQGFSGDMRPRILEKQSLWPPSFDTLWSLLFDRVRFKKNCTEDDMRNLADTLREDIEAIKLCKIENPRLDAAASLVSLPLAKGGEKIEVEVNRVSFSDEVCFVGVNGEVFSSYARILRGYAPHAFPVGLCGGCVGYLPDIRALDQGGYEPVRSLPVFGLSAPFSKATEWLLREALWKAVHP